MSYVLEQLPQLCYSQCFCCTLLCVCLFVSSCIHFARRHKHSLSSLLLDKAIQCTFISLCLAPPQLHNVDFCCVIWEGEGAGNSL